jgi:hypothetical protein
MKIKRCTVLKDVDTTYTSGTTGGSNSLLIDGLPDFCADVRNKLSPFLTLIALGLTDEDPRLNDLRRRAAEQGNVSLGYILERLESLECVSRRQK